MDADPMIFRAPLDILLAAGADPNVQIGRSGAILHRNARGGNVRSIRLLIQAGADLNIQDSNGQTALHFAASAQYIPKSESEHARLQEKTNGEQSIVYLDEDYLIYMVVPMQLYVNTVKLLIDMCVDVNLRNRDGDTALDIAIRKGHTEIATLLSHYQKRVSNRIQE